MKESQSAVVDSSRESKAPLQSDALSRVEWIDIARGIAIILVIVGHAWTSKDLQRLLQPFRMPLFYITTGYLFNYQKHRPALFKYLKHRCQRLVSPYLVTAIFFFLVSWVVNGMIVKRYFDEPGKMLAAILYGNGSQRHGEAYILRMDIPLWFLCCMTSCSVLFVSLLHFFRNERNNFAMLATSMIIAAAGFLIGENPSLPFLPWSFDVAMVTQFFMMIGFWLHQSGAAFSSKRLFFIMLAGYLYMYCSKNYLDLNDRRYHDLGLLFAEGTAGTYLIYFLSRRLCLMRKNDPWARRLGELFKFFGRNTMVIMAFHFGGFYAINLLMKYCCPGFMNLRFFELYTFLLMLAVSLAAILVINTVKPLRKIYYK